MNILADISNRRKLGQIQLECNETYTMADIAVGTQEKEIQRIQEINIYKDKLIKERRKFLLRKIKMETVKMKKKEISRYLQRERKKMKMKMKMKNDGTIRNISE